MTFHYSTTSEVYLKFSYFSEEIWIKLTDISAWQVQSKKIVLANGKEFVVESLQPLYDYFDKKNQTALPNLTVMPGPGQPLGSGLGRKLK